MLGLEDWQIGAAVLGFILLLCGFMAAVGDDPPPRLPWPSIDL